MTVANFAVAWTPTSRRALARSPEKVATAAMAIEHRSDAYRLDKPAR